MPHTNSKKRGSAADKAKNASGRPAKIRRVKEVNFDEDARKEFLTGFSKRKKERQTAVRNKAIQREREEKLEARKSIRQERKERAAQNVRTARELYGDAGGTEDEDEGTNDGSDSDADSDASSIAGAPKADETAYEGGDILTTVVVKPMSLSRSPTPEVIPDLVHYDPDVSGPSQPIAVIHKRRIKNKPQMRPKMSREDKKARATGGKKAKKLAEKKGRGTKGRANK